MKLFLLLTFLLTCVGSAVIGIRLLRAGLRSRQTPELIYGLSLLLSASSAVVRLVVQGILGGGEAYYVWMVVAGCLRFATLVTLAWGIRAIYRASQGWAWLPTVALWLAGAAGLGVVCAYPGGLEQVGLLYMLGDFVPGFALSWGAVESFSYYGKMHRRMALGLADPVVTERFRIWGIGFSLAVLAVTLLVGGTWWFGVSVAQIPALLLAIQLAMAAMTVATWVAFYPPEWFVQRVRDKAGSGGTTSLGGA